MCKAESPSFDQKVSEMLFKNPNAIVRIRGQELTKEQAVKPYQAVAARLDQTDEVIIDNQNLQGVRPIPKGEIILPKIY